ncbi:DMT family transporter [Alphaproteobacteria bacterium]|jgi:drug/metabolite transporter (DMT)-like permease|nr:DMT family transporter [Alphaproteobacteria bacterium]
MPKNLITAIFVLIFGIFAFDLMSILVRMLGGSYPIMQVSAFRNFFGIIPAAILLWRFKQFDTLRQINRPRLHVILLLRSIAVLVAQYCFYTALTKIEFATACALGFTGPLFITALSIPILGHRVGLWRWLAICIGFVGMLTVLRPYDADFSSYMIYPVIAAFGYALSSLLVRLYPEDMPSSTIQFTQQILTTILSVVVLFGFATPVAIASQADMGLLLAMGVFGGTGIMCLVTAYRLTDPASISPFEYFGIPISFTLGWVVFGEAPFDDLFPGILFIISAGLLIVYRERKVARV